MQRSNLLKNIAELMNAYRMKQGQFADFIGVDRSNFSKIIKGNYPCGEGIINKIVLATGVNKQWLKTGEGEKFSEKNNEASDIELPKVPETDKNDSQMVTSLLSLIKEQGQALKEIALNQDKKYIEDQAAVLEKIEMLRKMLENNSRDFQKVMEGIERLLRDNLSERKNVS